MEEKRANVHDGSEVLTKKQVASLLACSPRHVEMLQRRGAIPVIRIGRRFTRYRRSAVLGALAKFETEAITA